MVIAHEMSLLGFETITFWLPEHDTNNSKVIALIPREHMNLQVAMDKICL